MRQAAAKGTIPTTEQQTMLLPGEAIKYTVNLMATPGRLARPPIREALVDLRVEAQQPADPAAFKALAQSLKSRYPFSAEKRQFEAQFKTKAGQVPDARARDLGFHAIVLKDAETKESRVLQLRVDGFTLSLLSEYNSAEALLEEAGSLWNGYLTAARPTRVIRVALRYINELALPFRAGDDFSRFLNAPATMPSDAPQEVASFLTRVVVPYGSLAGPIIGVVTQRLDDSRAPVAPYVLDIDVFQVQDQPTDFPSLSSLFGELRAFKNRLFFSFLTDESLEPYR